MLDSLKKKLSFNFFQNTDKKVIKITFYALKNNKYSEKKINKQIRTRLKQAYLLSHDSIIELS